MIDKQIELSNNRHIRVKIFPGNQDNLMNNIYVVTTAEKRPLPMWATNTTRKTWNGLSTSNSTFPDRTHWS